MTFEPHELRKVRFRDADKRIDVLAHLPEVIWGARSESDLYHRLVNLILAGVGHAEAVAIVTAEGGDAGEPRVLHWDRRRETAGSFHPSSRLATDALVKRHRSVLHVWEPANRSGENYTAVAEFDWAFCTPVPQPTGAPWGLYVAGKLDRRQMDSDTANTETMPLHADVKFTELVAEIISTVQRLNKLEGQRAGFRQFFAPPILAALGDDPNTKLLEPRECDVTVLFCDLRGFSQQAEGAANDLIGLLDRVSRALGVMTDQILKHGGVTGDFQGDAALGFWGWPFASSEAPLNACRAALAIRAAFAETHGRHDHPLANFEMGIGIAHGRAVAGKIGTSEQVKVTVFGPVVNLANRLESMTKQLRVPILLDEATAEIVRKRLDVAEGRTRRLAKVLPYGMEKPVIVSELLPPASEAPELTDAHLKQYEEGVDLFIAGRWDEAYRCLHAMPAGDRAQDFLTMRIAQFSRVAPADWDGIVRLPSK
jgi:adenylate cyclase